MDGMRCNEHARLSTHDALDLLNPDTKDEAFYVLV